VDGGVSVARSRTRLWVSYGAAWLPFAVYWGAVVLLGRGSPSFAVVAALVMMAGAALLGTGIWWLSGRYPWSDRGVLGWLLRHAVFAAVFAASLATLDAWLSALAAGRSLGGFLRADPGFALRGVLVYVWLYGLVAAVCYAIRAHRRLEAEAVAAAHAQAQAAQAQLRALRAQLNPHFLFNALHSLSALVRANPDAAEEALERLGDMLRYALADAESEDVRLSDEWAFTRHYLALESLRLGPRLRLETRVDSEALSCVVPCFLLQPLVENAIRHGIATRAAGGTLFVGAELLGDDLLIHVRDDGPGTLPERAQAARGIGLRVLRERLLSRYPGEGKSAAEVRVETSPGAGFAVRVRLPVRLLPLLRETA
jgi:signal transduction histidine kinase